MLLKIHLAITLFFVLVFLSSVENKIIFIIIAVFATYLPDIDSRYSKIGRKKITRILNWFTKHRGIIHSFSFLLIIIIFLVLFFPVAAFGFFLGYGLHLFADSFTPAGIRPFYPSKKISKGKIRTGGIIERGVLIAFVILDLILILQMVSRVI
jgi:membrane-bound metal-dependent hydrolase YbcI (DUF457 family)